MPRGSTQARAKIAHRRLAAFLGIFIVVHFAAHFAAIGGIASQQRVLEAGRTIYRMPPVEAALVAAFAAQLLLGIQLLRSIARRKRKDGWHYAQVFSGAYLALFIVMHTGAALLSREIAGLDTNFHWAAGTLILSPIKYGFAPYYALAIFALVTHLVAALHYRQPHRWHAVLLLLGPAAAIPILLAYSGAFYPVALPEAHLAYFRTYLPVPD